MTGNKKELLLVVKIPHMKQLKILRRIIPSQTKTSHQDLPNCLKF